MSLVATRAEQFEQLARAVHAPVLRYLLRRTDAETAADVLADTLGVLWRRLDDVPRAAPADPADPADPTDPADPETGLLGAPLAWSYAVARRCLANAERGMRRQRALAARIVLLDPPPSTAPDASETSAVSDEVHRALARVPAEDAELLRLWAWEQLEPREIAVVLGISANAASIRLHRAKSRLRQVMTRQDSGQDPGVAGQEQVAGGDRS